MSLDPEALSVVEECVGPADITSATRLSGGASAQMWSLIASKSGTEHAWILRMSRPGEAGMSIGPLAEVEVQQAAQAKGVPVPVVVGASERGYLMEQLDGEALPAKIMRDPRFAEARAGLVAGVARALAAIHTVQAESVPSAPVLTAADQLDQLEGLHRSLGQPVPAFEIALRWLRDHASGADATGLVHGDFRTGNLMIDESGLQAVLDWELAHRGERWEDLGWFCAPAWRFGGDTAGGLGSRDDFYAAYAAASGVDVDVDRVRFWEVLACLKWGVICQFQASRHLSGQTRSVELAAIGRRVTETELDLLLLLDGVVR